MGGCGKARNLQCEDKRKSLFSMLQASCDDLPDYSAGDMPYLDLLQRKEDCLFLF